MAVAGLICIAGFVAKAETSDGGRMTASEAFSSLPVSVLDLLDNSRRLDMLDYYAVDSIVKVPNTMEGVSYNKPYDKLGTEVEVQIRKKRFPGKVVKKRFYDKNYKK